MSKLRTFYDRKVTLHTAEDSFTADNQLSRWSNKDLDPVPRAQKTWEWYHVGGFWIAEGFAAAYIQTASASVALGLNPGLIVVALLVGNLIMAVACAGSGYIGAKVGEAIEKMTALRSEPGNRIAGARLNAEPG